MKISAANRLRILYFLVFSCAASWLPIFADYLKDHGLSGINIGITLSIPPFMMFLVQPAYGILADRLGYKKCLLIASLLATASYIFYLFNGSFTYIFLVTIGMSLFYNAIQPLLDSLALTLTEKDPKFSYGTLRIAGAAGWAFTGIIVGHFIQNINTNVIFASSAISMFLTFLFSFSLKADNKKNTPANTESYKHLKNIISQKKLILLLIAVFLVSLGTTAIWNFYSIYMKENGATASLVGYGISFQGLCELPLFYFSAKIISRLGIRTTLLITIFASVVRLFLYSAIKNPNIAIAIEMLHGISWSLFWVVCVEYVNMLVKEEWRATGQSLLYAAYYGAGAIAGNFWTGFLYDTKMKVADIFLLNAGIVAGTGLLVWIFTRRNEIVLTKTM